MEDIKNDIAEDIKAHIIAKQAEYKIGSDAYNVLRHLEITIPNMIQETLTVPDIRNKLSPITHLIGMIEREEPDFIEKAIPQAKISVNYLAQREVYEKR